MLFPENIEKIIKSISDLLDQSSLNIRGIEFLKEFIAYYENLKSIDECYKSIFSDEAIIRKLKKIDDDKEIKLLDSIFKKLKELIYEMMTTVPSPTNDHYSAYFINIEPCFDDKQVGRFFYLALDYIKIYMDYNSVKNIPIHFGKIISELEPYWNEKDKLINVSTFIPLCDAFYYKDKEIVIYPCYRHSYELKEKFAEFYKKIKSNGGILSISASRFSLISEYSKISYLQEERLFGMPFKKDSFKRLFKKEYGEYIYDENEKNNYMLLPLYKLQYVINPLDKNQVSLMIEEIIDISMKNVNNEKIGTDSKFFVRNRLIHCIFDTIKDNFIHFDLSYLYYDNNAYYKRIEQGIWQKREDATIKHKIFRIDGSLDFNIACLLIGAALDANHNPEVINFLKGK